MSVDILQTHLLSEMWSSYVMTLCGRENIPHSYERHEGRETLNESKIYHDGKTPYDLLPGY